MRSSNCRNSAVSSSIVLGGGLGGKGITSDMGRTSLVMQPAWQVLFPCNCRISAAPKFAISTKAIGPAKVPFARPGLTGALGHTFNAG